MSPRGDHIWACTGPMVQEAAGSSSEALPTVAEVLSTTTLVSCSLETCRRLVLDGQQVLLRVTHAPSGREPKLDALRGRQLLQVCSGSTSTDITPENTLENLLQLIDETGQAPQIDEVDLVFSRDEPDPMRKEVLRLKKNLLRDPDTPQTSLNANTLLVHLHPVGIRKRIVKELTQLPSGSCLYFSHSNWFLSDLGALLKLPPNKVKELDLSHNGIVHVGPELSRFEQMVDLRLPGNGIKEIDLHYLPRLKNLGLAFNKLQALPELAGLPALEELDLCDNEIGSRVSSEDMGSSGSSPDGWECLSHSDLQELKVLLLANNALAWTQTDFNLRIAILSEKPSIEKLDFRGNLMLFSPRLDDLPPLEKYREWILTHCKKLEFLDDEEILESDHLFLLVNPIIGEPSAGDDVAGGGDDDATDSQDPERMPVFGGVHQPRTADLNVLSSMLTETFVLPAHLASDTLDKVQRALSGLMAVPPTMRYLFPAEELEAAPTGNGSAHAEANGEATLAVVDADDDPDGDDTNQLGLKEARRRARIGHEIQLHKLEKGSSPDGQFLSDAELARKEDEFIKETIGTREGQKALMAADTESTKLMEFDPELFAQLGAQAGAENTLVAEQEEDMNIGAARQTDEYRDPSDVIDDFLQQLQIIFERAPKGHLVSTPELERTSAVSEALEQLESGQAPVVAKGEAISIGERTIRLLTSCCTLMGDRRWGDVLSERAKLLLLEMLTATEELEDLIISQALTVLVPPILQSHCKDWVQFANFQVLCLLVKANPLVGLQLTALAPTLKTVIVAEEGTAPQPLFSLIGLLANYEELFPRTKGTRPDSHFSGSPSQALHDAGMTTAIAHWLCNSASTMPTWTRHRQLCIWNIAEGISQHVRAAAFKLVDAGLAQRVKDELLKECRGEALTRWPREKSIYVTQLILCADALGKYVNRARAILYALPSRFGCVLGSEDETWAQVYEEQESFCVLTVVLPMLLDMPARAQPALLAGLLTLLGSLVATANGAMLGALSEIILKVHPIIKLAQSRQEGGFLEEILRNTHHKRVDDEGDSTSVGEPLARDDPSMHNMLLQLVRVITAYASRAEEWRKATAAANLGHGPTPDAKNELAVAVTTAFDEEGRDRLIFKLLQNSPDESLKIAAMECLSKVPVAALERSEVEEIVEFVLEKVRLHEVYVGRNEELMMYAFNCLARLVRVPDEVNGRRSAGTFFRRDYCHLVQIAMQLLRQNSARDIPQSAGSEREQKAQLSHALTGFLQACSGPAEGSEHEQDAPNIWPQAVSVLQMREMTVSMLEIMQNEETFGDSNDHISLERSALADKVEPLLYTLQSISIQSTIKARLLNRLAELLEGELPDTGSPFELDEDGDGIPDGNNEIEKKLRNKRLQHHVSFHRKGGVDLVLTQLEDQMSELRQELANAAEQTLRDVDGDGVGDTPMGGEEQKGDGILPPEAQPEVVKSKVANVLQFVEMEEKRAEIAMTFAADGDEGDPHEMDMAVKEFVNWHVYGEAALYSEELHLMDDLGEGNQKQDTPLVSGSVIVEAKKSEAELGEEQALKTIWMHAEQSVAAALRILTACIKFGGTETINVFLDRLLLPSTQNDVLMIAGHVGVFTTARESESALRLVEFFKEALRAITEREIKEGDVNPSLLPLLDVLARLLPRLLLPYAERMGKALDLWKLHAADRSSSAVDDDFLRNQSTEDHKMLRALVQLAGLYSRMLTTLEEMRFSQDDEVDVAAKELALRRLLPPKSTQATSQSETDIDNNALAAFLSAIFYDSVLRMSEGWEPSQYVSKSNDSLARQEVIAAVKGVLASFCVIDEERRFELFQLTARLEARWGIQLSPAVMHAITDLTEHALYKRALEPYLLRRRIMEPENERVLEATWMVQELPKHQPSTLVVVTNRAIYLLSTPMLSGVCQQCESWKLCPDGPKLKTRIPLYKVSKVIVDFTANPAYGAGHRMKIVYSSNSPTSLIPTDLGSPNEMLSGVVTGCGELAQQCASRAKQALPFGTKPSAKGDVRQKQADAVQDEGGPEDDQNASGAGRTGEVPQPSANVKKFGLKKHEIQFSSLLVGVVQKLALAIRSGSAGHEPEMILDSFATRAIELQRAQVLQASKGKMRAAAKLELFVEPFHCLLAMRTEVSTQNPEDIADNGSPPKELLLVLSGERIEFFEEKVSLFAVPPHHDGGSMRHQAEGFSGDGINSLKQVMSVHLDEITSLELEMSAEPRARMKIEGKVILLTFADDTGAMLWRYHMRLALWGTGKASWTGSSLGGGHPGPQRQKSSRNDRGLKGPGM